MSQKTKLTYIEIFNIVKNDGNELLTNEYINMKTKMEFKCKCGEVFITNYDSYKNKNKKQCNECGKSILRKSNTSSIEEVKNYIESKGCKLVSNYINAKAKLKLICNCGEEFEKSFNKFKQGQTKCRHCTNRKEWNNESISELLKSEGNELISKEELTSSSEILVKCKCNNEYTTTFRNYLYDNKRTCNDCTKIRVSETKRIGIDKLKEIVSINSDSILISEDYINFKENLTFKCKCNNEFKTSMISFNNGKKSCDKCSPKSKLEYITDLYLNNNNYNYETQHTFEDLLSIKGRKLKFDFIIYFKDYYILLELDGEQHFKPSNLFGEDKFKTQVIHDKLKNEYCEKNNIILYRISYKELNNLELVLDDLLSKHDNPVPS